MIIKNNFNAKNVNPLNDYNNIGKGSHSIERQLDDEKKGFIKDNINDPILQQLRDDDSEEEDIKEDKWDFFR